MDMQNDRAIWGRQFGSFLQIYLIYNAAIPLTGVYAGEMKILFSHKTFYVNVGSSFINDHKKLEATYIYFNQWMNKETVMYPYSGILVSYKSDYYFLNKYKNPLISHSSGGWEIQDQDANRFYVWWRPSA